MTGGYGISLEGKKKGLLYLYVLLVWRSFWHGKGDHLMDQQLLSDAVITIINYAIPIVIGVLIIAVGVKIVKKHK